MNIPEPRGESAPPPVPVHYPLAASARLDLDAVSAHSGLHPDLVRRFVALGLVPAWRDAAGTLWFPPEAVATLARIQRLRTGLDLNYAAIGLVLDLLDRIRRLEAALRVTRSERPWT